MASTTAQTLSSPLFCNFQQSEKWREHKVWKNWSQHTKFLKLDGPMIILQHHGLGWVLMHQQEKKLSLQRSNLRLLDTGLSPATTA
jgi:hypothetical protein